MALAFQSHIGLKHARCTPQLSTFAKYSSTSSYTDSHSLPCSSICQLVQLPSFSSLILSCIHGLTGHTCFIMNLQSSNELVIGLEHLVGDFPDGVNLSMSMFWVVLQCLQKVSQKIYLLKIADQNTVDLALILNSALNGIESLLSLPSSLVHPMPEFAILWSLVFWHVTNFIKVVYIPFFTFLDDWRCSALVLDDWNQWKINNASPGSIVVDQLVKLYCLYSFYTTNNYDESTFLGAGIVTYDNWLSKPRITKFTSDTILDNLCYSNILYNRTGDVQDDSTMEHFYMTLLFKSVHPRPFSELRPLNFIVQKSL